jgi:hypothetical protein
MKIVLSKMRGKKRKREENICNTVTYSDSMLSSLSSHKGAEWIITRAPEGSLQFFFKKGSYLSIIRNRRNRQRDDNCER